MPKSVTVCSTKCRATTYWTFLDGIIGDTGFSALTHIPSLGQQLKLESIGGKPRSEHIPEEKWEPSPEKRGGLSGSTPGTGTKSQVQELQGLRTVLLCTNAKKRRPV